MVTEREQLGHPISVADALIAAICRTRRTTPATRNTEDFTDTGIEVFDPWNHHSHQATDTARGK